MTLMDGTTGQVVGQTGTNVMTNGGNMVGSASANTLGAPGTFMGVGVDQLVTVGGTIAEGMGAGDAAYLQAEADKEAADTLYERNRDKLQEGVDLDSPTITLDKDAWKQSKANTTPEQTAGQTEGLLQQGIPLGQVAAGNVPVAPVAAPGTTPPKKFDSTIDSGLLNKATT
jgi:hypothetical protein